MSEHSHDPGTPRRRSGKQRFGTIFRPAPFLPDQERSPSRDDIPLPPDFIIHLR
ncbi:hypothetical protein ABDK96_04375 [Citricoccus nitrophenolicus]|uniref:Uncharacterized protein n=1 Tax=Citricoccus nitrophenolicus TaxID=863575 RepID=A0ABV0IHE1_9MICC|nr:hypothetical protein [Citricoccus sp. I39-566]NUL47766.1 hypothetical protein [Cellulosimicrobium funkei]WMY78833.1 hypothetical protein RE421_02875 [Citricoccus sp. I39-566]